MSADPAASWGAVLDRLEADIAVAVSGGPLASWTPPQDLGPCPVELVDRAARVLDAQQETTSILAKSRSAAAAHLDALDSIPDFSISSHAVYLDVRA